MKQLLVLRHAKSSWKEAGIPDHDRPLNGRGRRDAPRMGQLLLGEDLVPDWILSSTARRARKTAARVARECGFTAEVDERRELYLATPEDYAAALRTLQDEIGRAMVVGHNPGLENLVSRLTGEDITMPTAALAVVDLPLDSWSRFATSLRGNLQQLICPRDLE